MHAVKRTLDFAERTVLPAMQGGPEDQAQEIMQLFGYEETRGMKYDEFLYFLADMFVMQVQYGHRTEFCTKMEAEPELDDLDLMRYISNFVYTGGVEDYNSAFMRETKIVPEKNYRQWTWQYC